MAVTRLKVMLMPMMHRKHRKNLSAKKQTMDADSWRAETARLWDSFGYRNEPF
jgi:hypothetical protein